MPKIVIFFRWLWRHLTSERFPKQISKAFLNLKVLFVEVLSLCGFIYGLWKAAHGELFH